VKPLLAGFPYDSVAVLVVLFGFDQEGIVLKYNKGFKSRKNLLLHSWNVGARSFEKVFIIHKSLMVMFSLVKERPCSFQEKSLHVFELYKLLLLLGNLLVGVEGESLRVIDRSPNFSLLESHKDFSMLAHDQVAIGVFDDGVLDDAVVVGWKLDLLGSLLHYGFILLLYEIIRAHDNSGGQGILV
jgi:hypothetical protein